MLKLPRPFIAALHDIMMAALSLSASLYLRLGDDFLAKYSHFIPSVLIFTAVCAVVFYFMGLYKGVWRYASLQDLVNITKSVTLATLIFLPAMFMVNRLDEFPRSVLIINMLVLLAFLGGPRILYRMLKDKNFSFGAFGHIDDKRVRVILVGMCDSSVHFLRESSSRSSSDYKVVAIVDKQANKGRKIHGVEVYGTIDDMPQIISRLKKEGESPSRIIIGQDNISSENITKLLVLADETGLTLAKLPKMSDFKDNIDKIEIKPIAIEDLLGRPQQAPSLGRRDELLKNKNILVTGAGGTIGSELVRQICSYNPDELVLIEVSEFNLYQIDKELEERFPNIKRSSYIGDIRNASRLDEIFEQHKPHIVFHAAALKHVPIVENNIVEAALTNILGTKNVADMALKHHADKMVAISTDKAVNPTSLMGVTKRVAECYVQGLGKENTSTLFSTVRFGNVLGSSGSVIPLFQKQLEKGGPVTVTHPDMVRFFMTVPEAVELVLQASAIQTYESSIFVLDMGKPVNINDLALQMIKLAGLTPEKDIKIEYTGIRPGEKLYEELFYENEKKRDTLYEGIMFADARTVDFTKLSEQIAEIASICNERKTKEVVEILSTIVPEYEPNPQVEEAA